MLTEESDFIVAFPLSVLFFNSSINSEDWSLQFELLIKNSQRTHYALKYVQCKNQERKWLHETTNFYTNKKIALNHYIFALVIARRCFILNRAKLQMWDIIQQIFLFLHHSITKYQGIILIQKLKKFVQRIFRKTKKMLFWVYGRIRWRVYNILTINLSLKKVV